MFRFQNTECIKLYHIKVHLLTFFSLSYTKETPSPLLLLLFSSQFSNYIQNDVTAQGLGLASGQEKPGLILLRLSPFTQKPKGLKWSHHHLDERSRFKTTQLLSLVRYLLHTQLEKRLPLPRFKPPSPGHVVIMLTIELHHFQIAKTITVNNIFEDYPI